MPRQLVSASKKEEKRTGRKVKFVSIDAKSESISNVVYHQFVYPLSEHHVLVYTNLPVP